jgi:hemerythrin-like domain-containing protein
MKLSQHELLIIIRSLCNELNKNENNIQYPDDAWSMNEKYVKKIKKYLIKENETIKIMLQKFLKQKGVNND